MSPKRGTRLPQCRALPTCGPCADVPRSFAYAIRGDTNSYLEDYAAAKKDYRKAIDLIDAGNKSTWKVRRYMGLDNCYSAEGNKEE